MKTHKIKTNATQTLCPPEVGLQSIEAAMVGGGVGSGTSCAGSTLSSLLLCTAWTSSAQSGSREASVEGGGLNGPPKSYSVFGTFWAFLGAKKKLF